MVHRGGGWGGGRETRKSGKKGVDESQITTVV